MIARGGVRLDRLAERSFQLITHLLLSLPRPRRRQSSDLKDLEFLTLSILQQQQTMIVGDIQRILGVLPAQMSRLIRSLEARAEPFVLCRINPQDKRKIDVQLTPAGERALTEYVSPRLQTITALLEGLSDEEREALSHLLDRLNSLREGNE